MIVLYLCINKNLNVYGIVSVVSEGEWVRKYWVLKIIDLVKFRLNED